MQIRTISVTDAARNFSECVNRTRYQGVTFILHRNGIPVARIVPEGKEPQVAVPEAGLACTGTTPEVEHSESKPTRSLW